MQHHREPSHPFKERACFVFWGGHVYFLIRARGTCGLLVRGLGLVNSRRIRSPTENNKVTRDKTSHFFRRMSLPVGGYGNKMWRRDRKSKCGFRDARSNCSREKNHSKCDRTKSDYHLKISNNFQCNLKEIQLRLVSWFSRSIGVSFKGR